MSENQSVLLSVEGDIAQLRLNRPEAGNSLNELMIHALRDVARTLVESPPRAVVLLAQGRHFCAGGDLRAFEALGESIGPSLRELTKVYNEFVTAMTSLDAPLIAAVQGPAAGAGLSLVCMCDVAMASPRALFSAAYTRVGLTPDGGLTYHLPRIVGLRRALDLVLTNRFFSAKEACALGIVNEVVEADRLESRCLDLAAKLAEGSTMALGTSKRLLRSSFDATLAEQLEQESLCFSVSTATSDAAEGRTAFFEKRPPVFRRP
jgi:2-(1,2-epoxy-1,2-dihydrophenyl)acetyl-CoA isomerase